MTVDQLAARVDRLEQLLDALIDSDAAQSKVNLSAGRVFDLFGQRLDNIEAALLHIVGDAPARGDA